MYTNNYDFSFLAYVSLTLSVSLFILLLSFYRFFLFWKTSVDRICGVTCKGVYFNNKSLLFLKIQNQVFIVWNIKKEGTIKEGTIRIELLKFP